MIWVSNEVDDGSIERVLLLHFLNKVGKNPGAWKADQAVNWKCWAKLGSTANEAEIITIGAGHVHDVVISAWLDIGYDFGFGVRRAHPRFPKYPVRKVKPGAKKKSDPQRSNQEEQK